jgi:uncharacterized membrane protein
VPEQATLRADERTCDRHLTDPSWQLSVLVLPLAPACRIHGPDRWEEFCMTIEWTRGGFAAPEWFDLTLHWTAIIIEGGGVAVIALGVLSATIVAIRQMIRDGIWAEAYLVFRVSLGRSLILGLEFLVAADIIGTVAVKPTIQNLATLGLIVLIRSFLSFVLEVEITGSWPWQKSSPKERIPETLP